MFISKDRQGVPNEIDEPIYLIYLYIYIYIFIYIYIYISFLYFFFKGGSLSIFFNLCEILNKNEEKSCQNPFLLIFLVCMVLVHPAKRLVETSLIEILKPGKIVVSVRPFCPNTARQWPHLGFLTFFIEGMGGEGLFFLKKKLFFKRNGLFI